METSDEEPKSYLVAHVREALARDSRVNELNVDIAVAGRRVFLTGEVATPERRSAVADVVSELLPGYEIHNETTVSAFSEPEDEEELA